ncbi:MAG: four helix bundle protein [Kiritimatiellae bacterium]|nr:four helix bundle protein [Kiritimatiellia bacterium]
MHGPAPTPANGDGGLIPKHGGYRNTKTWQLADLIYDVTVLFCDRFVDRRSRTHDQMVQAGRSGVQNLQEGSIDSAVSKKLELKMTGTARGSLEELGRDFQKFLKHRGLPEWGPSHPALVRFRALRCATLEEFRAWVADEVRRAGEEHTDAHGQAQTDTRRPADGKRVCPCVSVPPPPVPPAALPAVVAANGALSLLNLCIHLVKRQMQAQADAFEREGGFTQRLYRRRRERRSRGKD